jgi:hypothetical protein
MILVHVFVPTSAAATVIVAMAGNARTTYAAVPTNAAATTIATKKQFARTIYAYPLTYPANVLRRTLAMMLVNVFVNTNAAVTMIAAMAMNA